MGNPVRLQVVLELEDNEFNPDERIKEIVKGNIEFSLGAKVLKIVKVGNCEEAQYIAENLRRAARSGGPFARISLTTTFATYIADILDGGEKSDTGNRGEPEGCADYHYGSVVPDETVQSNSEDDL